MTTVPNDELVKQGRAWIAECEWPDLDPEEVDNLRPAQVIRGIERHYAGGLAQFIEDSQPIAT
jgi:hypothetical protein